MIPRSRHFAELRALLDLQPVVGILGARQVGKTTAARQLMAAWEGPTLRFDLEDPEDLARLADAKLALAPLRGLVVIDEIQRRPELFPILRVLVDRPDNPATFLVLGSASPELLRQSSESLAGRISYHELNGLALDEVGGSSLDRLWLRGGFPRSYLADSEAASVRWRRSFVRTFLERDLPELGIRIPGTTLYRFWQMIAHWHGQLWNGSELARAFGVSRGTVARYLDLLTGALVLRQLPPWHENLSKRQVKSPKVYVSDSGLLHTLLGLVDEHALRGHPKVGASWEGFILEQVRSLLGLEREECYFWATHSGAELDLLVVRGNRRYGFEIKRTSAPRLRRSAHAAIEALGLDRLTLIHAGEHTFPLAEGVTAVAAGRLLHDLAPV